MSTLDSFLPEVRPWAPGVPDATAYRAIRNAAIEFCERTLMWKYENTIAVLATDSSTRSMTSPAGSVPHDIEVATFEAIELDPIAARDMDAKLPGWRDTSASTGTPKYLTQIDHDTLTIVPAPIGDGSLYVRMRLKPSQTATTLPDFLTKYAECIGWGALGRILTVPGQSYTNPDLGAFYATRFREKIDNLSGMATKGQQNARKRTKARFY